MLKRIQGKKQVMEIPVMISTVSFSIIMKPVPKTGRYFWKMLLQARSRFKKCRNTWKGGGESTVST
jgi:hypothetical protein